MKLQKNLLEYLEAAAQAFPGKTAFADEQASLTFSSLKEKAEALGTRLARLTTAVNRPVAVLVGRNVESAAALFGALYSGSFYVPLDR